MLSPLALLPEDLAGRDRRLPVVLLGERPADGGTDHVGIDNVRAAREATEHLLARGRRRIAVLGGAVRAGRAPAGCAPTATGRRWPRPGAVRPGTGGAGRGVPLADGARAAAGVLRAPRPPDALLCMNDQLALGALRAAHEAGRSVPGDLNMWWGSTTSRPRGSACRR
ncbi:LacI family transcriptional regulator OS=Streptomyces fumanus OX=67302 GN=GCM10018772_18660 PE=4 SV=1 [Streptomyces fumanus]